MEQMKQVPVCPWCGYVVNDEGGDPSTVVDEVDIHLACLHASEQLQCLSRIAAAIEKQAQLQSFAMNTTRAIAAALPDSFHAVKAHMMNPPPDGLPSGVAPLDPMSLFGPAPDAPPQLDPSNVAAAVEILRSVAAVVGESEAKHIKVALGLLGDKV